MPILRNLKSKGNGLVFKNIFKKAEEKFAANDGAIFGGLKNKASKTFPYAMMRLNINAKTIPRRILSSPFFIRD